MLSKAEIARSLSKEVNTSNCVLVQFFHSTFYREGLSEEQYLSVFKSFITELDECLLNNKNFSLDDTFLKDKEFTSLKIPKKVLKQMELEYLESKAYIESVIKEINN